MKKRAWIQIAFGQAQIVGATIALCFLIATGASRATVIAIVATGFVSLLSILIFD